MSARGVLIVSLLLAALSGCRPHVADVTIAPGAKLLVVPVGMLRPRTELPVVTVEVAQTPQQRERGLGGRRGLPPDSGMLFVYDNDGMRVYWMKDCPMALDIAFLDNDRRIVNVATLPPGTGLRDVEIPRTASTGPARYVLETEAGWMARHHLASGDLVDLAPALVGVQPR